MFTYIGFLALQGHGLTCLLKTVNSKQVNLENLMQLNNKHRPPLPPKKPHITKTEEN